MLDLSNPANARYAEHRGDCAQNVGSVAKIVLALAIGTQKIIDQAHPAEAAAPQ